ncbi:MAG: transposase [Terriglobales bacterium]
MPSGLRRFHESGQCHFVTFSCYRRCPYFATVEVFDLFVRCLEDMRLRFDVSVYGYVVMPEHVHLLLSEPAAFARDCSSRGSQVSAQRTGANLGHLSDSATLAEAMHYLKLSFAKRVRRFRSSGSQVSAQRTGANLGHPTSGSFWEKRYYDRNVRDYEEFTVKLRYVHRNPVKRGLVLRPEEWKWSSFRHYALREIGAVEIESEWTAGDRERKAYGGGERVFLRPK